MPTSCLYIFHLCYCSFPLLPLYCISCQPQLLLRLFVLLFWFVMYFPYSQWRLFLQLSTANCLLISAYFLQLLKMPVNISVLISLVLTCNCLVILLKHRTLHMNSRITVYFNMSQIMINKINYYSNFPQAVNITQIFQKIATFFQMWADKKIEIIHLFRKQ